MDDRSHLLGGILPDAFPYAHHVAARRVHHLATAIPDQLDGDDFGSKSGDDHHVAGFEPGDVLCGRPRLQATDPEVRHLRVHVRVVDNFPEQKNPSVRKNLSGRVGQIDRPLDPVAEPELLREPDRCRSGGEHAAAGADHLDKLAPVVALDLGLHMGHHVGRAQVHTRGMGLAGLHGYPAFVPASAGSGLTAGNVAPGFLESRRKNKRRFRWIQIVKIPRVRLVIPRSAACLPDL